MENLNAEQVKKALECCAAAHSSYCRNCPIDIKKQENCECGTFLAGQALALINKQETEYNELYELCESYRIERDAMRGVANAYKMHIIELTTENERLRAENNQWREDWANNQTIWEKNYDSACDIVSRLETDLKTAKADTVRKMHSEIKERCIKGGIYPAFVASTIDQIAKEILEGG